jgi:hypothetical protein
MVNLKKYNDVSKLFYILNIFFLLLPAANKTTTLLRSKENGYNYWKENQVPEIENFIKPYREHINNDLDSILAYCPETLDKSTGKWQTTIGNLMADVTLSRGNTVFQSEKKRI